MENRLRPQPNLSRVVPYAKYLLKTQGEEVRNPEWQGIRVSEKPDMVTYELLNFGFTAEIDRYHHDLPLLQGDVKPNLPWADDHFQERVCGEPVNPGVEWARWPWGNSADKFRESGGQFNHNYMERYWPKYAGRTPTGHLGPEPLKDPHFGIRNEYGDLDDLITSLVKNPLSRQEWFPLFHPEDVGEVVGGRKPCSLGYQFMVRDSALHIFYPMRSCDVIRHLADDIYLTVRLGMWVIEQCTLKDGSWGLVQLGSLNMHCTSLHCFINDLRTL